MIIRTHSRREKVSMLYELLEWLEPLLLLLRIGQEVRRRVSLVRGLWASWVIASPQAICVAAR